MNRHAFTLAPGKTRLKDVKVTVPEGYMLTITDYVERQVHEVSELLHPASHDSWIHFRNEELQFRVERGIWQSFGRIHLYFYSSRKKQVRAAIQYDAIRKPERGLPRTTPKAEISWHLDETDIVLPSLLESCAKMSWQPLINTGLFEPKGLKGGSPGEHAYVWSKKGEDASE